jgi:BlaI family transcriptional regulator, penicillinase repressor
VAHKKGGPSSRLLTEVELELMTIIWRGGTVTVKDVMAALPEDRALAYTSVATVMKILEQKGFLVCQKDSHAHTYQARVPRDEYERQCVDHMVNNVFGGEPVALVQRLLDARDLSARDLQSLQAALKRLGGDRKKALK